MTTTTEEEAEADQGRTSRAALALFIDSRRVASFFKCQRKKKQNRTRRRGEVGVGTTDWDINWKQRRGKEGTASSLWLQVEKEDE